MNKQMKNGYIIDTKLEPETSVCRHCKKRNQHVVVTGIQRWGYGNNQIMAFFNCPVCNSRWYYDVGKHHNHDKLVNMGLIDPKTGKFTDFDPIHYDLTKIHNRYVSESLEYLRKNFKIGR